MTRSLSCAKMACAIASCPSGAHSPPQPSESAYGLQVQTVLPPINSSCEDEEGYEGSSVPRLTEKVSICRKKEKCDRRLRQEVGGKSGTLGLLLALEHRLERYSRNI